MHNITNTLNGINEVKISLNLKEHLNFYDFSMIETTIENGNKIISEINKTIHSTITKGKYGSFEIQLETFDFEYKNRNVSTTEKDFIARIADINDNIIIEINEYAEIKAIQNLNKIQLRLEEKIEKLAKNNVGDKVNETFQYLRDFYKNEKRIILDTKNYKQHGLLLNTFYGSYTPTSYKKNKIRYLNFMDNTVVNIEEQAKVRRIKIEKRELEIEVTGKFDEPFYNDMFIKSLQEKEIFFDAENDKPILDKYEGSFIFDMDFGVVKSANITIEFSFGKNYNKTINYQLKETNDADNN
ncbi:hypothetical protein [Flavobacterium sp.]|uniref:hypothetical protein n=1 Tax=Flavobacterium sp. TaxID=239 RepID=UPI00286C3C82|nr:hypothetical protein [Flavobacterium sp.]